LLNQVLICYSHSQISEPCQVFETSVSYLYVMILSCILVTRQQHILSSKLSFTSIIPDSSLNLINMVWRQSCFCSPAQTLQLSDNREFSFIIWHFKMCITSLLPNAILWKCQITLHNFVFFSFCR
jgi:hypothetical protein